MSMIYWMYNDNSIKSVLVDECNELRKSMLHVHKLLWLYKEVVQLFNINCYDAYIPQVIHVC